MVSAKGKRKLPTKGQLISNQEAPCNTSGPDIAVGTGLGAGVVIGRVQQGVTELAAVYSCWVLLYFWVDQTTWANIIILSCSQVPIHNGPLPTSNLPANITKTPLQSQEGYQIPNTMWWFMICVWILWISLIASKVSKTMPDSQRLDTTLERLALYFFPAQLRERLLKSFS